MSLVTNQLPDTSRDSRGKHKYDKKSMARNVNSVVLSYMKMYIIEIMDLFIQYIPGIMYMVNAFYVLLWFGNDPFDPYPVQYDCRMSERDCRMSECDCRMSKYDCRSMMVACCSASIVTHRILLALRHDTIILKGYWMIRANIWQKS